MTRPECVAAAREEIRACFRQCKRPTDLLRYMMAGDTVRTDEMREAFTLEGYRVEGSNVWGRRRVPRVTPPWLRT